jgi:hypothetical protein
MSSTAELSGETTSHSLNLCQRRHDFDGIQPGGKNECASELGCDPNGEVVFLFGCSRTVQKITDFAFADMQSMLLVQISFVSYTAHGS